MANKETSAFQGLGQGRRCWQRSRAKAISVREKVVNGGLEMTLSSGDHMMYMEREEGQTGTGSNPLIPFDDGFDIRNEDWLRWTNLLQDL